MHVQTIPTQSSRPRGARTRLILARKEGESIVIGDDVTITAYRIRRGHMRVLIEAPQAVRVDRAEVRARRNLEPAA